MIQELIESNAKAILIMFGILLVLIIMAIVGSGLLGGLNIGKVF